MSGRRQKKLLPLQKWGRCGWRLISTQYRDPEPYKPSLMGLPGTSSLKILCCRFFLKRCRQLWNTNCVTLEWHFLTCNALIVHYLSICTVYTGLFHIVLISWVWTSCMKRTVWSLIYMPVWDMKRWPIIFLFIIISVIFMFGDIYYISGIFSKTRWMPALRVGSQPIYRASIF